MLVIEVRKAVGQDVLEVGVNAADRRKACEEKLAAAEARRVELEARWEAEKALADRLLEIRAKLRQAVDAEKAPAEKK